MSMDKYLRPSHLDVDPSDKSADKHWFHWFKTFSNFVGSIANMTEQKKLTALVNYASPSIYEMIADCVTYEEATTILVAAFVKPKSGIFARYALCTRHQDPSETMYQYVQVLRALAKDCDIKEVTAEANRDEHIRDAFISGLYDGNIRKRLLESDTLTLSTAIQNSRTLELAKNNAAQYLSTRPDIAATAASVCSTEEAVGGAAR